VVRDGGPTKVPFQPDNKKAKPNDPKTWTDFETASGVVGSFSGVGFVLSPDDPFCGIDLDGCRDPHTGKVAEWARSLIFELNSYAEVSPSETGVKVFARAKLPFESGRKVTVKENPICDKMPAIEVYDSLRYFAVTGWRLQGMRDVLERQDVVDRICRRFFPETGAVRSQANAAYYCEPAVIERARKYLDRLPGAVSGQNGHGATFRAACVLILGFCLPEQAALQLLQEYNQRCQPPWTEKELTHKVRQAAKQPGQRGYLRNVPFERQHAVSIPDYRERLFAEIRTTTLVDAAKQYLESLSDGRQPLVETGIPDLDYALGGGVERGELIIFAARPSHGKSAVGLQCAHHWTQQSMPCAIVSEEMSALALGKRTVQFASRVHQEYWPDFRDQLDRDIEGYSASRAKCLILEGCGTAANVIRAVDDAVAREGVQCLIVDYAQLLRGYGKSRYEQVTEVSITLRQLASKHKLVVLALCQMGRDIDSRAEFKPKLSDLKDTGQFEQDADVVIFLCWPWRINQEERQDKYQFFVAKNRNRPINQHAVECRFDPTHQMILAPRVEAASTQEEQCDREKS
jgi:KaiC/GvpD/RAD55 family RecA-like ATPase